jgi:hypothetical protein
MDVKEFKCASDVYLRVYMSLYTYCWYARNNTHNSGTFASALAC